MSAITTGGFGKWLIDSLFEAGTIGNPAEPGIIGTVIKPLGIACMTVAVFIIMLKAVQHLLIVAQARDQEASPISMTWAPIHLVIAVVLCMPLPSGYTGGQYFAIWLGEQSNTLGNITSQRAVSYFENKGVITPPPLPSIPKIVDSLIASHMCMELENRFGEHLNRLTGNQNAPYIEPRMMSAEEIKVADIKKAGDNYSTYGITFAREGEGLIDSGPLNNYCGSVVVQFRSSLDSAKVDNPENLDGACEGMGGWLSCQSSDLMGYENPRRLAIQTYSKAHINAVNAIFREALASEGARTIALNLLYDLELHLDGNLDSQSSQELLTAQYQQLQRINLAAEQTMKLIDILQTDIYKSYASAMSEFQLSENPLGETWIDTAERVGWPILGLYWFQMTNTSRNVMESVGIRAVSSANVNMYLDRAERNTEDTALIRRIKERFTQYRLIFAHKFQSSRFDSSPLSASNNTNQSASEKLENHNNALALRDSFPLLTEEILIGAARGSTKPEDMIDAISARFNQMLRAVFFSKLIKGLKEDNIVNSLVNTGHMLINYGEAAYVLKLYLESSGTINSDNSVSLDSDEDDGFWSNAIQSVAEFALPDIVFTIVKMALNALVDLLEMSTYLFYAGVFLAFYLPAMIMIQWLIGFVTWMIYIVEATIVIPLWGLLFVGDMGSKSFAPETARQGFIHMLSILIYPSMMVIGFVIGLKIIDLASMFLIDFLLIGFVNSTEGYTFGIISLFAGIFIIGLACYQVIVRVFSLVLEINERAISWVGQRVSYGESGFDNSIKNNVVAVINEWKSRRR